MANLSPTDQKLLNHFCERFSLTPDEKHQIEAAGVTSEQLSLLVITIMPKEGTPSSEPLKSIRFPNDGQKETFFDMIAAGKIEDVISIIESAGGGHFDRPKDRRTAVSSSQATPK